MDQPEGLGAGRCFKQCLLLQDVQAHHRPDQERQDQGIGRLGRKLVDIEPPLRTRQLECPGRQLEDRAAQGLDFGPLVLRQR